MKKKFFISCCLFIHISFAFLQVYKQSAFVKLSYQTQKNEKLLAELNAQKSTLFYKLEKLKDRTELKSYAINSLTMAPIKITTVKQLTHDQA